MSELVPVPSPGVPLFYGQPGDPVVVVLHDMYGRLPGLEPFAVALASRGFRVAVPDLYAGVCTVDTATAHGLMARLDIATALAEVDDTVVAAQLTGDEKVGLVGFSLGGWLHSFTLKRERRMRPSRTTRASATRSMASSHAPSCCNGQKWRSGMRARTPHPSLRA